MRPFLHTSSLLLALLLFLPATARRSRADAAGDLEALLPKLSSADTKELKEAVDQLLVLSSSASRPGAAAEAVALTKVIAVKAGDDKVAKPARVWLIRQLEYIGGAEAVPVLAEIFAGDDKDLSDCARRALEKNDSPEAVAAMRDALKNGAGLTKTIGLIHSLGLRRDAESVSLIEGRLEHPATALTAASALGRIASKEAVQALFKLGVANKNASQGLVIAADVLAARGSRRGAAAIYKRLYEGATTMKAKGSAMVGYANYSSEVDLTRLVEDGFRSKDPNLQAASATILQELKGKKEFAPLAAKLNAGLADYPANVKVMLLSTLSGVDDKPVIAAASDPDEQVRIAAVEALGRIGTEASVPVLLQALNGRSKGVRDAASKALTENAGPEISRAIAQAAETGENLDRINAIKALGMREGTTDALIKFAMEGDTAISGAAFGALRGAATERDLKKIAELVVSKPNNDSSAALRSLVGRVSDKAGASRIILGLVRSAPPRTQGLLLTAVAPLGGRSALSAVVKASESEDSELRDRGIRALADWPDFDAADRLVEIGADKSRTETHHVIAMRGFSRILRNAKTTPAATRVTVAKSALDAARRNDEKREIINALGTIPTARSIDVVRGYYKDKALKEEAGQAAVRIADALVAKNKALAHKIAQDVKVAKISKGVTDGADRVLKK